MRYRFIFYIFLLFVLPKFLYAQENSDFSTQKINQIQFKGAKFVEKGVLFSLIKSRIGSSISQETIIDDMKELFKTAYFQDIQVEVEQTQQNKINLIFFLKEKARLSKINIEGNTILSTSDIQEKLKIHKNNPINFDLIKEDLNTITNEYRDKGYLRTEVHYKIQEINEQQVELTYYIKEAPQVYLTKINISGTKYFYPIDIKRSMQSSEIDCFSWITQSGVFHEDKIKTDIQLISQKYFLEGFIKVAIDPPKIQLITNPDYSRVIVDINIKEGEQYFIGKVDVVTDDDIPLIIKKEKILKKLNLQSGQIFNPFLQNQDKALIQNIYFEQGYAFSKTKIENKVDDEKHLVDIIFHVIKGEKAYMGRIEFSGNYDTRDYVIRRELDIYDNELLNGIRLRKSQVKIRRLGFFDHQINAEQEAGSSEIELDYNLYLKEIQTGTFTASISYSEEIGTSLILNVTKKNFRGKGQTLSMQGQLSTTDYQRYDISFTEPYFFGEKIFSTINFFYNYDTRFDYTNKTVGYSYRMGYYFWDDWYVSLQYLSKDREYIDISSDDDDLPYTNGYNTIYHTLRTGINYNDIDHPQFPTEGLEASVYVEKNGGEDFFGIQGLSLGGKEEYNRYDFNTRYFYSFNNERTVTFMAQFQMSSLQETNPNKIIPYEQRLRLGGITTMRGFEIWEIEGPYSEVERSPSFDLNALKNAAHDSEDYQDYLYLINHRGGKVQRLLNLELLFPLTREGRNIRGVVFFDAGNVWAEDRIYKITGARNDPWYYRKSIGAGVRLITPMGVLRFEYGTKVDKKPGESSGKFDFHISGLF